MKKILILILTISYTYAQSDVDSFLEKYKTVFHAFYKSNGIEGKMKTRDSYELYTVKFKSENCSKSIVFIQGWNESSYKYAELFYNLYTQGFCVYSFDLRGQGLSSRMTEIPMKSHLNDYHDYVIDMAEFMKEVVLPDQPKDLYLLGHSTGGLIGGLYLLDNHDQFTHALFSSPFLKLSTKPFPYPIARLVAYAGAKGKNKDHYAPGQENYDAYVDFSSNKLTQSLKRFEMGKLVLAMYPDTRLGGVTNNWVNEMFKATKFLRKKAGNIKTPMTILSAQKDKMVKNSGQVSFAKKTKNLSERFIIKEASHEMFMERDFIRNEVLSIIKKKFQRKDQ